MSTTSTLFHFIFDFVTFYVVMRAADSVIFDTMNSRVITLPHEMDVCSLICRILIIFFVIFVSWHKAEFRAQFLADECKL